MALLFLGLVLGTHTSSVDAKDSSDSLISGHLIDKLRNGNESEGLKAISDLDDISRSLKSAANELLIIFLNEKNSPGLRVAALRTHFEILGISKDFRKKLDDVINIAKSKTEPASVRNAAILFLTVAAKDIKSPDIARALVKILADQKNNSEVRSTAAGFLAGSPTIAKDAVNTMVAVLKNRNDVLEVRLHIAEAIWVAACLSPQNGESVTLVLSEVIRDSKQPLRLRVKSLDSMLQLALRASTVKISLKPFRKSTMSWLIEALTNADEDQGIRASSASLLSIFVSPLYDPPQKEHVSSLIKALKCNEAFARQYAAKALSQIGDNGRNALPILRNIVNNPKEDAETRKAAADAIETINSKKEK